ncbi:hypothetical protein A2U01_0046643, partial [Trifolium medium]|nr:hypothetical protein [Trifolium medium]
MTVLTGSCLGVCSGIGCLEVGCSEVGCSEGISPESRDVSISAATLIPSATVSRSDSEVIGG